MLLASEGMGLDRKGTLGVPDGDVVMVEQATPDAQLEAMAKELEALAEQLRGMMGSADGATNASTKDTSTSEFGVGKRVRIIVRGKFYWRTAVLLSRRGRLYWNMRLEERDGEVERELYKAETSLRVIDA